MNPSYERTRQWTRETAPIWATWEYGPDEWAAFDARESAHVQRDLRSALRAEGVLIGLAAVAAVVANYLGTVFQCATTPLLLFAGGLVVLVTAAYVHTREELAEEHRARRRGPRFVVITPLGVEIAGIYLPFVGLRRQLLRVYVRGDDPQVLRFRVAPYGALAGQQPEIWVPIPQGREAEARELAARFQREVVRTR